jgi:menaquinol-cytochrome c reductase iron-sulfur subunit
MGDDDPNRRKFLQVATCGIGGAVGLAVVAPAIGLIAAPSRRQIVTTPKDPIDIGDIGMLGPSWRKVDVIAPEVRDAWVTARDVLLGSAFIRKQGDKIEALSGVCPHLGCPVGVEARGFLCACHNTKFGASGEVVEGPAKRGLDPLPIAVVGDRLRLTWVSYKLDIKGREPA